MRGWFNLAVAFKKLVYRWRWAISASLAMIILIIELIEHFSHIIQDSWIDFVYLVLIIPLLFGFVLSLMDAKEKLSHVNTQLELQKVVKHQLENAEDWNELVTILLQIPRMIFPLVSDALIVYDLETSAYKLASEWSIFGSRQASAFSSFLDSNRIEKLFSQEALSATVVPFPCDSGEPATAQPRYYYLPLLDGKIPVGLLGFELSQLITHPDGFDLLNGIALDMALAVRRFQLDRLVISQSNHYLEEKQRLVRHLHDTLAHNLAYLRLKIEQLSIESSYREVEDLQRELRRLLPVADQSYEQVRTSLSELHDATQINLTSAIKEYTASLGQRVGFSIEVSQKGRTRPLPPHVSRQVLYIIREALRNVEKHANAHQVMVNINWAEDRLIVETSDDGRGFNPNKIGNNKDDFGLQIIRECAAELNGHLMISSVPSRGTLVQLQVPY